MFEETLKQIEETRSKNNIEWMKILRIAMEYAPEETQEVLRQIRKHDERVVALVKELSNEPTF